MFVAAVLQSAYGGAELVLFMSTYNVAALTACANTQTKPMLQIKQMAVEMLDAASARAGSFGRVNFT
jgi:hypothetical protein